MKIAWVPAAAYVAQHYCEFQRQFGHVSAHHRLLRGHAKKQHNFQLILKVLGRDYQIYNARKLHLFHQYSEHSIMQRFSQCFDVHSHRNTEVNCVY